MPKTTMKLLKTACALCLSFVMLFAGVPAASADTTGAAASKATKGTATSSAQLETVKVWGIYDYKEAFKALNIVNKERAAAGVGKLKMSKSLLATAMRRAAETSILSSHTRPNGEDCTDANSLMYAENIASGLMDANSAVGVWMGSSNHRAAMLDPNFTTVGVGSFFTFEGKPFWTLCFGCDLDKEAKKASYPSKKTTTTSIKIKTGKFTIGNNSYKFKFYIKAKKTLKKGKTTTAYVLLRNSNKIAGSFYEQALLSNSSLKWKSSNKKVATVSKKGKIKAKKKGKTTITVKSKNGLIVKKFKVKVK